MNIRKLAIEPTYKKENGLWSLNIRDLLPKIEFIPVEQSLILIPPNQFGGNHKHPRTEAFIGVGRRLELIWKDDEGALHEEAMNEEKLYLFIVPPFVPHAVINKSSDMDAILYEFADAKQHEVELIEIYN
ncbi:hypothetical protein HGB07_05820 [Candidatus Roizmanbacteria bacterium]|nr:hypothetical protein [Candidatus Roizmanbacteria bacterium]